MNEPKPPSSAPSQPATSAFAEDALPPLPTRQDWKPGPRRFGRFAVQRLHAKGGLGEVHVAIDEELRRDVALKRMQERFVNDAASKRRFLNEAEVTAKLEHPGIVPIYGLVQDENSQPCYAMRFIEGESLAEAIQRFHTPEAEAQRGSDTHRLAALRPPRAADFASLPFRQLLQRFISVCNTIAYAHSKHVIHRDIKPANIMLGPFGETLVVDWGLARELSSRDCERAEDAAEEQAVAATTNFSPASPDERLYTQAGQALGTPAYMAPEQAAGRWSVVGPCSDIYSLGATLYELLTGVRSVRGQDALDVLQKVQTGDFPAPRQVNAKVPKALEAICLKAMALRPEARYPSAAELAADLEHWLADEPAAAWREPWMARAGRWMRKHRTLVTVAAALLVTAVVGLAIGLAAVDHERQQTAHERDEKSKALDAEIQARKLTMAALRDLTDDIVERQMARGPQLTDENKEFLRKTIRHFEGFAAITANDASSRGIRAEGYYRVGLVRARFGELGDAEPALTAALALFKELAAEYPNRPELRQYLGSIHTNLGLTYQQVGRFKEAESAEVEGLAIAKELAAEFPKRLEFQVQLCRAQNSLGTLFFHTARFNEARTELLAAMERYRRLAADNPKDYILREELAGNHHRLGDLLRNTGRVTEAQAAYGEALVLYKQLVAEFPSRPEFRWNLAKTANNLGILHKDIGRLKEAESAYAEALAIRKQLVAEFPAMLAFREDLAISHMNMGDLFYSTGRPREAESAFNEALAGYRQLTASFASRPEFRQGLASTLNNLAMLLQANNRLKEAEPVYAESLTLKKQLAAEFPDQPDRRNDLAGTFVNLANLCIDRRDFAAAKAYLDEAQAHHQAALQANPRHPQYRQFFRNNLFALVTAYAGLSDHERATQMAGKIRDLGWNPPDDASEAAYSLVACIPIVETDDRHSAEERRTAAQGYGDQAMAMLRDALAKGYRDVARVKQDSDLDPLRKRDDFQKLVKELEGKQ